MKISAGVACAPSIRNEVLHKIKLKKSNRHKEHYEKHQQTIKSLGKLYKNSLQDNLFDKCE